MAACGSETGRWANTHLTSVDPKATFAAFSSAVGFQERGYKEGPIPPVCLFRLDSVQRPVKSLRAREGGRPKTRLNAWENDGVSANPTAAPFELRTSPFSPGTSIAMSRVMIGL